jgi:sulfite exporter TauE/SafE
MDGLSMLPIFMIGLLGSVHCVGMCGGIVGALSVSRPPRPFPVAVVALGSGALDGALRMAAYNAGRIGSYAIAGALAGGVAAGAQVLMGVAWLQAGGYWLANLMLVALGLYLMDAWRGLARLEAGGQAIWRRLQPLMQYLLPLDSPLKMLAVGALWGWLPCGMVYSVLMTAMMTGSARSGASVMLVFGLGTLPTLLAMGMLGNSLKDWMQRRAVRLASGLVILVFGVLGLARASGGLPPSWLDALCVSPATSAAQP